MRPFSYKSPSRRNCASLKRAVNTEKDCWTVFFLVRTCVNDALRCARSRILALERPRPFLYTGRIPSQVPAVQPVYGCRYNWRCLETGGSFVAPVDSHGILPATAQLENLFNYTCRLKTFRSGEYILKILLGILLEKLSKVKFLKIIIYFVTLFNYM